MKRIYRRILKNLAKIFFLAIMVLTIILSVNGLEITEIMFNPDGSDKGYEWIEIYGCDNISEYKLLENSINHNIRLFLEKVPVDDACISIICDDCEKLLDNIYDESEKNFYLYDSSFSLNNNGEVIRIINGEEILDEVDYSLHLPIDEGLSLQKINSSWIGKNHTFGKYNLIIGNPDEEILENDTMEENITIIEENSTGEINNTGGINNTQTNNTTENNITVNKTMEENNISENLSLKCYINTGISLFEEKIFQNREKIRFYNEIYSIKDSQNNTLEDKEFIFEYWIEDLSGNILKKPVNTTNVNQKTFTPGITESDKVMIIKNRLYVDCLNESIGSEKIVIITNDDPEELEKGCEENSGKDKNKDYGESYIHISESNKKVMIEAYRGDTRKYSIDIIIEGNREFDHNIKLDKGSRVIASYPVPGYPCGSRLRVEGLGLEKELDLACKEPEITEGTVNITTSQEVLNDKTAKNVSNSFIEQQFPELKKFNYSNETKETVYKSSARQNKTYIIAGLTVILTVAAFILLAKGGLKDFLDKR